ETRYLDRREESYVGPLVRVMGDYIGGRTFVHAGGRHDCAYGVALIG
ncbi:hypothetical protein HZC08_00410, partial [Candidatus Micrarchaeota archaeon]|nr:hypothetical protein [Candidatus Micrarchaeota archaeon]